MENMQPIVLDIETRTDPALTSNPQYVAWLRENTEPDSRIKDPAKKRADVEAKVRKRLDRMALSGTTAMVSVVGVCGLNDLEPTILQADEESREAERVLLEDLALWLVDSWDQRSPIITYNGRLFDLPVLAARAMVAGCDLPIPKARDYARHVDIYDDVFGREGKQVEWQLAIDGMLPKPVDHASLSIVEQADKCDEDVRLLRRMAVRTAAIWSWRSQR